MDNEVISNALSQLSNAMRIYSEYFLRYLSLLDIDREEAIHNVDRSFENNLEKFHTLYDVSKEIYDFHSHADTSLMISIRNALHHRNHPLFVSLIQEVWLDSPQNKVLEEKYFIAQHQIKSGKSMMSHLVKLEDIYSRLDPRCKSSYFDNFAKRSPEKFISLQQELGFEKIWECSRKNGYQDSKVYIDLLPIFNSAISRTFTILDQEGINFKGFDAETYRDFFIENIEVDLNSIDYMCLEINQNNIWKGPMLLIDDTATKPIHV